MNSVETAAPNPNPSKDNTGSFFSRDISDIAFKKCLIGLCVLGLVIRVLFFLEHVRSPSFGVPTLDQTYYDTVAQMLLAGEDLHALHGFRPLLYPLYLAGCYKIGAGWGIDLSIFLQHLMGIATGIIAALLGARLFRHRLSGVTAGALYLLAPVPLYFEGELLIEPSYLFLICIGLWLHLVAAEKKGGKAIVLWMICGAIISLAAQGRANILVFLAVYPLFAAWRWWQVRKPVGFIPVLGLAGALIMSVIWGFVNLCQSPYFQLLPNQGGVALYCGNKRNADGMTPVQDRRITTGNRYEDSIEVWARQEYEAAMRAKGLEPDKNPMAISHYWTERTKEEIKADPGRWIKLLAKKTWLNFWNVEVPNNKAFAFLQQEFVWLRVLPVRWVVLLVLAPAGLWLAWRSGNRDALVILAIYVGMYTAGNVLFFVCDRYRYPVWPAMAALAGGGLMLVVESIRGREFKRLAWVGASVLILGALSLHNWFGAKLPTYARDYLFRSLACYQKGQFPAALADIDQSLALDPSDVNAVHHRGNVFFALEQYEPAVAAYGQVLQREPGEGSTWNNLGAALEALGKTDQAVAAYQRATECQPPSKNAFCGIALLELSRGRSTEAGLAIDRFEKISRTEDAAMLVIKAAWLRASGNAAQADQLEQRARSLDAEAAKWALEKVAKSKLR